mmetsp:Transcript_19968/g.67519  ORF Transcript_19968/g.67519 Transcript_19968/m.67519 type:complete len:252 (-) Transcript_19968:218-973(-)
MPRCRPFGARGLRRSPFRLRLRWRPAGKSNTRARTCAGSESRHGLHTAFWWSGLPFATRSSLVARPSACPRERQPGRDEGSTGSPLWYVPWYATKVPRFVSAEHASSSSTARSRPSQRWSSRSHSRTRTISCVRLENAVAALQADASSCGQKTVQPVLPRAAGKHEPLCACPRAVVAALTAKSPPWLPLRKWSSLPGPARSWMSAQVTSRSVESPTKTIPSHRLARACAGISGCELSTNQSKCLSLARAWT